MSIDEAQVRAAAEAVTDPELRRTLGELGMVRPSVQEETLLSPAHKSYTWVPVIWLLMVEFLATAAVQLPKPLQKEEFAPPSAASKNGCGAGVAPLLSAQ